MKKLIVTIDDHGVYHVESELIQCKDCIHQEKVFHEDKRMKTGGWWIYSCNRNGDPFTRHVVDGSPDEWCSRAEGKEEAGS